MSKRDIRVVDASSVRDKPRLKTISSSVPGLTPVHWSFVARTSDDLSLVFLVDHGSQRIQRIVGADVSYADDRVLIRMLAVVVLASGPITLQSLVSEHMINLASPLGGREVIDPAR